MLNMDWNYHQRYLSVNHLLVQGQVRVLLTCPDILDSSPSATGYPCPLERDPPFAALLLSAEAPGLEFL